jgi:hypothetical protein
MQKRILGTNGLEVSALGFGCMGISQSYGQPMSRQDVRAGYRRMIEGSVARRAGTPDEVGAVGALLMGPDGGFITGSDFLMDGGVTAAYWYGDVGEVRA